VDINLTIIGQTIAMIVFVWFCMKFIWPPVMQALDDRRQQIADGLAAAEKGQQELIKAQARFEETIRESRDQAAEIIRQAELRSREIVAEAQQNAVAEGERLIAQARSEIEQEANRARDVLRGQVAEIAMEGAGRLLGREVDAATHQDLLNKLTSEL
jgi:F-type H+-transporting ATPase subunit b